MYYILVLEKAKATMLSHI